MIGTVGRPYHVHVIRLFPGEDVRGELEAWCADRNIEAASVISSVGSVSAAALRYGGRSEPSMINGDLEVCSLSGTLSRHGLHLHMAVADPKGHMTGGHLLAGTKVRTTLEVVIQEIGGLRMIRRMDDRTGYPELVPEPILP